MNFFVAAIALALRHFMLAQLPGEASLSIAVFVVELYQLYYETPRNVWSSDASTDTSIVEKVFGLPPALVTSSLPPGVITHRNYIGLPDLASESLLSLYQPTPSMCLLTDSPVDLDIGISPHASVASTYEDTYEGLNPVHETTHEDVDLVRETTHRDADLVHEDTYKDAYLVRDDTHEDVCPVPVGIFEDVCPVPVDIRADVRSALVDAHEDVYSVQKPSTVSLSVAAILIIIVFGLVLGFATFSAPHIMALQAKMALEDGAVRSRWYTVIGTILASTPAAISTGRVLTTTTRFKGTVDSQNLFLALLVIALILLKLCSVYSDTCHLHGSSHILIGSAGFMDDSPSSPLYVVDSSVKEPDSDGHVNDLVILQSDSMDLCLSALFESVPRIVSTISSNAIMNVSVTEAACTSVGGTMIIAEAGVDTAGKGIVDFSGPAIELDPAMIPLPLDDDNDLFSSGTEVVLFPTLDERSCLSVMIEPTTVCTPVKDDTLDLAAGSFVQRSTNSTQSVCSELVLQKTDAGKPAMIADVIQPDVSAVGCCIDPALIPLPEPVEDEFAINPLEVPLPGDDSDWSESDASVDLSSRSSPNAAEDLAVFPIDNDLFKAKEVSVTEEPSHEPKLIVSSTSSMSILDAEADVEHDADNIIFYPIGMSCSLVSYGSSEEGSAPGPFSFDLTSLNCSGTSVAQSDLRSPLHCEDNFSNSVGKESVEEEGKSETLFFSKQNVSSAPHLCPGTPNRSTDLPCNLKWSMDYGRKSVDDLDADVNAETKDSLPRSRDHVKKIESSSQQSSGVLSTPGRYPKFIGL